MSLKGFTGLKHVIRVDSDDTPTCQLCADGLQADSTVAEAINHYIEAHGYRLLHIGTETSIEYETAALWHITVAFSGK